MNPKVVQNISGSQVTQVFQTEARPGVPRCLLPNSTLLFGRNAVIDKLVKRLTARRAGVVAICAVRGLPGVGKTDVLRAVGCDKRITKHFAGGVLYAELGPTPDAAQLLRRWLTELDQPIPQIDDAETLAALVREKLAERLALLIIDDVWQSGLGAAKLLRACATPTCRVLTSSRSAEIAREVAKGDPPIELEVLEDDPALALLRQHAPAVVAADAAGAQKLALALGNLPLALRLAGRMLANDRRNPQPCAALLQTWQARLDDLRGYEQRPGMGDERLSLDAIIGLSYQALPDDAAQAAVALSVLGATPLDWDWEAMAAVWERDEEATTTLEATLMSSGLLDYDETSRRYSLHQTVQAFLAHRCTDPAYAQRHAAYYAALMQRCNQEAGHESTIDDALATLDREIGQIERGQAWVVNTPPASWRDALLIDYAFACGIYFGLRGRYGQMIEWLKAGRAAAQRHGRARDAAGLLGNIATVYQRTGRYDEAVAADEEIVTIFRKAGLDAETAMALNNLGTVYKQQGRYEDAITHYQQGLEIAQRLGDTATTAITLGNLGEVYRSQGRYEDAIAHYQQSLTITQRIGDTAGTAATLGNLGIVYHSQGRYEDAIAHYQQSLEIKQRIGDTAGTAMNYTSIGVLYEVQGKLEAAIEQYEQSLAITQRIGDLSTSAMNFGNLGIVYRLQGRYDEAIAYYQQCLAIAEQIGDVATIAAHSWNLGLLYEAQGDLAAALPLIERDVLWLEQIGHPDAAERRAYLEDVRARLGG
jgi:tetratricopeptide (TPR) repeat protein